MFTVGGFHGRLQLALVVQALAADQLQRVADRAPEGQVEYLAKLLGGQRQVGRAAHLAGRLLEDAAVACADRVDDQELLAHGAVDPAVSIGADLPVVGDEVVAGHQLRQSDAAHHQKALPALGLAAVALDDGAQAALHAARAFGLPARHDDALAQRAASRRRCRRSGCRPAPGCPAGPARVTTGQCRPLRAVAAAVCAAPTRARPPPAVCSRRRLPRRAPAGRLRSGQRHRPAPSRCACATAARWLAAPCRPAPATAGAPPRHRRR